MVAMANLSGIFPPANREIESLRREFLDVLAMQSRAVKENVNSELQKKRILDVEQSLLMHGQKEFVAAAKIQREAVDGFFGMMNQTGRSRLFKVLERPADVAWSAKRAMREDMIDFLTGRGKKLEAQGLGKNSFVARMFGADKYFDPDEIIRDQPTSQQSSPQMIQTENKASVDLLSKIEDNTSRLLSATVNKTKLDKKVANDNKVTKLRDAASSKIGGFIASGGGNALATAASTIGAVETTALVAGGATAGAAIAGTVGKFASKGLTAAKAVTGIGAALLGFAIDGLYGWFNAEKWGTSQLSGILGSTLTNSDEGLMGYFANMGKFAAAGAVAGSVVPVVGTIAGGLIGAALGAVVQFIGGEKIAKAFDSIGNTIGAWTDRIIGTSFVLDPQILKENLDKASERSDTLKKKFEESSTRLREINAEIDKAFLAGDLDLLQQLEKRRTVVAGENDRDKKELDDQLKKIDDIKKDIELAKMSYFDRVMNFFKEINDKLTTGVKVETPQVVLDRNSREIKKIDESIAVVEKRRDDALKSGDREEYESASKRLEYLKTKRSSLEEDAPKTGAQVIQRMSGDSVDSKIAENPRTSIVQDNYPSEETRRRGVLVEDLTKKTMGETTLLGTGDQKAKSLFEANVIDAESKKAEDEKIAAAGAGAGIAASIVSNNSMVNNNISVGVELNPRNVEPSYSSGIAGSRVQSR